MLRIVIAIFLLANTMAFFHARKFTHFDPDVTEKVDPIKLLFFKVM
jgi:hypothetical protein